MSRVTILKADDPDCLGGSAWGSKRCRAAVKAFNEALGLERPQFVLEYRNAEILAVVDEDDEAELNHSFQVGISSGLEQASKTLMEEAASRFKRGCDQEAKLLRGLSKKLEEQGKKEHPGARKT